MAPHDSARSHGRVRSLPKTSVRRCEGPGVLDAPSAAVLPPLLYVASMKVCTRLARVDRRRQVLGWRGNGMLPLEHVVLREHTPSYGAAQCTGTKCGLVLQ